MNIVINLDAGHLTVDHIRAGGLRSVLPEFYDLEKVVENNNWHADQNVMDHSLLALEAFDTCSLPGGDLEKPYGRYRRRELLRFAVLLHDIGKLKAYYGGDGQTGAPSHGPIGRWLMEPILKRLEFNEDESRYIADLIGDHILACDLIELAVKTDNDEYVVLLKTKRSDMWRDFLFLVYADAMGCKTNSPEVAKEIKARVALIETALQQTF